jgi:ubiquinone/menaquinone biosynthesis C-methylase UbiE
MSPRRITLDTRLIVPARFAGRRVLEPEVMDESDGVDAYAGGVATEHLSRMDDSFVRGAARLAVPNARVLDVGTGTGQIAVKLALKRPDLSVVGIDLSDAMISSARERARSAGVHRRFHLRKANARRIPFGRGEFDLVISNSVLHHLPDPAPTFDEMARVLAPGGRVFIRDLRRPLRSRMAAHIRTHGRHYNGKMKKLFADSVRAAFQVGEIREIVGESALAGCEVRPQMRTYLVVEGSPRRPYRAPRRSVR